MVDETNKKLIKENFESYLEIQERKTELSRENKAIIDDTARLLETKSTMVSKMFKFLKRKHDDAVDELGELNDLIDEVFD